MLSHFSDVKEFKQTFVPAITSTVAASQQIHYVNLCHRAWSLHFNRSDLPKAQVSAAAALHRWESPHSFQRVAFFHLDGGWRTIRSWQCWGMAGRSGWGWGRAAPDAAGISISACCCYHGYSDMQANPRCQTDNREDQLETQGEGR